jgi:cytochrome P450
MKPERFDPKDPAFIHDPYPVYEQLRAASPIFFHEGSGLWFCLDHEDVDFFLRDRRFGRAIDHVLSLEERGVDPPPPEYEPFTRLGRHSMFDMEPPEHTRIKLLVHKAFTPQRINGLRDSIQRITSGLLDRAAAKGHIEVIEEFATPLPVAVIAELLGVPEADRHKLRPWSQDIVAMYELDHTAEEAERAVRASEEFSDYLRYLGHQRHANPRDDLITALIQAQEAGDKLSEDEYVSVCVLLLNAGHEATVNVIGNGLFALLQNPDQLVLVRDNPRLIPTAIEELMRYDTPLQLFRRWVLAEVEYMGFTFKPGDELGLMFGAANRDPRVFAEPAALDIKRDPNPHLAFGAGVHYCLGAPLARLELEIAFATLLARFPNLAISDEPRFKPKYVIRGLEALRLTL